MFVYQEIIDLFFGNVILRYNNLKYIDPLFSQMKLFCRDFNHRQ